VSDLAEAERFYGEVLGLPHLYSFPNLAFYDCDGTRLLCEVEASPEPGAPHSSVLYFSVAEIQAGYASLCDQGVVFHGEPQLIHRHADGVEEWMAFFEDPFGNVHALMSQVPSAKRG